ncbi:MAG: hypothetical protein K2X39_01925 [Silvanigrellaceae bacterium]|nr:hypothetical protein [Silvanigrellaceae bacterium]
MTLKYLFALFLGISLFTNCSQRKVDADNLDLTNIETFLVPVEIMASHEEASLTNQASADEIVGMTMLIQSCRAAKLNREVRLSQGNFTVSLFKGEKGCKPSLRSLEIPSAGVYLPHKECFAGSGMLGEICNFYLKDNNSSLLQIQGIAYEFEKISENSYIRFYYKKEKN